MRMMRTVHGHLGRYIPKENNLLTFVKLACWRTQGHFFLSGMKIGTDISVGPLHTRTCILAAFFGVAALFPSPLCEHVRRVGTFYHRSAVVTFDSHGVQCGGQEGSRLTVTICSLEGKRRHVWQSRCAVWRARGVTFDSHDLLCGEHEGRSWVRRLSRHIWGGDVRYFLFWVFGFVLGRLWTCVNYLNPHISHGSCTSFFFFFVVVSCKRHLVVNI